MENMERQHTPQEKKLHDCSGEDTGRSQQILKAGSQISSFCVACVYANGQVDQAQGKMFFCVCGGGDCNITKENQGIE